MAEDIFSILGLELPGISQCPTDKVPMSSDSGRSHVLASPPLRPDGLRRTRLVLQYEKLRRRFALLSGSIPATRPGPVEGFLRGRCCKLSVGWVATALLGGRSSQPHIRV